MMLKTPKDSFFLTPDINMDREISLTVLLTKLWGRSSHIPLETIHYALHIFSKHSFQRKPMTKTAWLPKTFKISSQSQEPSFHPSLHLSFTLEQSNSGFPNLELTMLWIRQNHCDRADWLEVSGGSVCMSFLRSLAQSSHGKNFENNLIKSFISLWVTVDGLSG